MASNWWARGAYEDVKRFDFDGWRFPFGTNEHDSAWAFSWGKLRFAPGDAAGEIVAVGAPMSEFPQPGMVVVQPSTGPNGHMGIMDFDGMAISAQTHGVTRASNAAVWRPLVCRAYKEN